MKKITLIVIIFSLSFFLLIFIAGLIFPVNPNNYYPLNTNIPTSSTGQPGKFTLQEVNQHNQATDCWLAINSKVYDITSYITSNSHPGGRRNLTTNCGREATGIFSAIHSNFAWDLLGKYQIGTLTP